LKSHSPESGDFMLLGQSKRINELIINQVIAFSGRGLKFSEYYPAVLEK